MEPFAAKCAPVYCFSLPNIQRVRVSRSSAGSRICRFAPMGGTLSLIDSRPVSRPYDIYNLCLTSKGTHIGPFARAHVRPYPRRIVPTPIATSNLGALRLLASVRCCFSDL